MKHLGTACAPCAPRWCVLVVTATAILPGRGLALGERGPFPVARADSVDQTTSQKETSPAQKPFKDLINDLKSKDYETRKKAAQSLGELGPKAKEAVPALLEAMGNNNFQDPYSALSSSLWKIDRASYVGILKDKANGGLTRGSAVLGLLAIGPEAKEVAPIILDAASDTKDPIHAHALWALGYIGVDPAVAVPVLVDGLREGGQYSRVMAAQGLFALGPKAKKALPALEKALVDSDQRVRVEAAAAMWKVKQEAAPVLPVLVAALTFPNPSGDAPYRAIWFLRQMGPQAKSIFPQLLDLWKQEGPNGYNGWSLAPALKAIDPKAAAEAGIKEAPVRDRSTLQEKKN